MNNAFKFRIVDTGWPEGAHWAFPCNLSQNWSCYNAALVNPRQIGGPHLGSLSSFGRLGYYASAGAENLSKSYRGL